MNTLTYIQFAITAFGAILQQYIALKQAGVHPSVAAPAIVALANAAPGITDEHKATIAAVSTAAQSIAEAHTGQ